MYKKNPQARASALTSPYSRTHEVTKSRAHNTLLEKKFTEV